ncbi:MAG: sulfite exporter TauE/SafE family protein [Acidobacteriota bacterium]
MSNALIFLVALGFSGHCVGMCGLFPAALRTGAGSGGRAAGLQLLYHAGKISTYMFLGVLAAAAGLRLEPWGRSLALAAGSVLIVVGLATLAPRNLWPRLVQWLRGSPLCWILSGLLREARPLSAFSVGIFNGFVPCGLVYAMLAYVATLGSIERAALAMLSFGLGTLPALGLAGIVAHRLHLRLASGATAARLVQLSGLLTVLLGVLTLVRALARNGPHFHPLLAGAL